MPRSPPGRAWMLRMNERPVIFVASSSEQLPAVRQIRAGLRSKDWDVRVWDTQFAFSAAYIESLEKALDEADFAVVVMTGDDQANVRADAVVLPRDNVIFELGLFIGRLGRERCAFFHDASRDTRIASDLGGVKGADFYPDGEAGGPSRRTLAERVHEVKQQIHQVLQESGLRYKPDRERREVQQRRWQFLKQIEGAWWERMRTGDDDASALSLVNITLDAASSDGALLEGRAFDLEDRWLASWQASAQLELRPVPTLFYRWGGWHEGQQGSRMGGQGFIRFDAAVSGASTFYGSFYDTRFAQIKDGMAPTREKRFSFVRLDADDLGCMQDPRSAVARERLAQVRARLAWG